MTPVPKDIPLPLPLPEWLLVALLVISFLAHIVFVNLMLGGSLLTLWSQIKGLRDPRYDALAHELAKTITVNKSLAVVLGVAPLLSINTLYTIYFYTANVLTGSMWIAIIPLVTAAFLLTYLHKYTWGALERNKPLHIAINALAVAMFLFIPLIFLANVNLMLFPEKWGAIKGFLSALMLPNVFPRYLHFLLASMAVTGLFIFWYFGRYRYPFEERLKGLRRADIRRKGYSLALAASIGQFLIGPFVLLTLPSKGMGWNLLLVIFSGAALALPAMWWMWKAITGPDEGLDRHFGKVVGLMTVVVLFMGSGRHVYRANALEPHRRLMAARTEEFKRKADEARAELAAGRLAAAGPTEHPGAAIFKRNCSSCHNTEGRLVGPPVTEMHEIYASDKQALIAWIKAPGKKRPDYPQMPGFPQLSDEELDLITQYILEIEH
ncbi:MAG: c-type cytochrome [Flavobacteriales bacterium]